MRTTERNEASPSVSEGGGGVGRGGTTRLCRVSFRSPPCQGVMHRRHAVPCTDLHTRSRRVTRPGPKSAPDRKPSSLVPRSAASTAEPPSPAATGLPGFHPCWTPRRASRGEESHLKPAAHLAGPGPGVPGLPGLETGVRLGGGGHWSLWGGKIAHTVRRRQVPSTTYAREPALMSTLSSFGGPVEQIRPDTDG